MFKAIAVIALILMVAPAFAAEWPETLEIGGFEVTGIKGTIDANGSGKAVGKLTIPKVGAISTDLAMTSTQIVTGSSRVGFHIGGLKVDGSYLLDRRGLHGTGIIHTTPRPISDNNLVVHPNGTLDGRGRVNLGKGFAVNVQSKVSADGLEAKGSAPRKVSVDTPLAVYTFQGDIIISTEKTALKAAANGSVERRGRIGGMTSVYGPVSCDVDIRTGAAVINVGGADIEIDFW